MSTTGFRTVCLQLGSTCVLATTALLLVGTFEAFNHGGTRVMTIRGIKHPQLGMFAKHSRIFIRSSMRHTGMDFDVSS